MGEKLPEEDVRIIETTENGHNQNLPVFPGTQRRKLYFNPAYFERQLLLVCNFFKLHTFPRQFLKYSNICIQYFI